MPHLPHIWDSTEPGNIAPDMLCIAYYGGPYEWSEADIRRARAVYRLCEHPASITRETMSKCRGVGVEPGAGSVEQAVIACHWRHEAGHKDFTVYTSLSPGASRDYQPGMAGIISALRSNAPGRPFRIHVADWDGNPNSRPAVDGIEAWAKQYIGNYHGCDVSVLFGENDLVAV